MKVQPLQATAKVMPQPGSQPDLREKPRRPVTFTLAQRGRLGYCTNIGLQYILIMLHLTNLPGVPAKP
jgi:hypothetical protein